MAADTFLAADAEPETVILAVAAAALGTCEATGSARLARAAVAAVWALVARDRVAVPEHCEAGNFVGEQVAEHYEIGDDACSIQTCHDQDSAVLPAQPAVAQEGSLSAVHLGSVISDASTAAAACGGKTGGAQPARDARPLRPVSVDTLPPFPFPPSEAVALEGTFVDCPVVELLPGRMDEKGLNIPDVSPVDIWPRQADAPMAGRTLKDQEVDVHRVCSDLQDEMDEKDHVVPNWMPGSPRPPDATVPTAVMSFRVQESTQEPLEGLRAPKVVRRPVCNGLKDEMPEKDQDNPDGSPETFRPPSVAVTAAAKDEMYEKDQDNPDGSPQASLPSTVAMPASVRGLQDGTQAALEVSRVLKSDIDAKGPDNPDGLPAISLRLTEVKGQDNPHMPPESGMGCVPLNVNDHAKLAALLPHLTSAIRLAESHHLHDGVADLQLQRDELARLLGQTN